MNYIPLTDILKQDAESKYRVFPPKSEKVTFVKKETGQTESYDKYTALTNYNFGTQETPNPGPLLFEVCEVDSGFRGLEFDRKPGKDGKPDWYTFKLQGRFDLTNEEERLNVEAYNKLEKMDARGIAPYSAACVMEDFNPESYKSKEFKPLLWVKKDPVTNKPMPGSAPSRFWQVSRYIKWHILLPKMDADGNPVRDEKGEIETYLKPLADWVEKKVPTRPNVPVDPNDPSTYRMLTEDEVRMQVYRSLEGKQFRYKPVIKHPAVVVSKGTGRCDTSEEIVAAYLTTVPKEAQVVDQSQSAIQFGSQHQGNVEAMQARIAELQSQIANMQVATAVPQANPQPTAQTAANPVKSESDQDFVAGNGGNVIPQVNYQQQQGQGTVEAMQNRFTELQGQQPQPQPQVQVQSQPQQMQPPASNGAPNVAFDPNMYAQQQAPQMQAPQAQPQVQSQPQVNVQQQQPQTPPPQAQPQPQVNVQQQQQPQQFQMPQQMQPPASNGAPNVAFDPNMYAQQQAPQMQAPQMQGQPQMQPPQINL